MGLPSGSFSEGASTPHPLLSCWRMEQQSLALSLQANQPIVSMKCIVLPNQSHSPHPALQTAVSSSQRMSIQCSLLPLQLDKHRSSLSSSKIKTSTMRSQPQQGQSLKKFPNPPLRLFGMLHMRSICSGFIEQKCRCLNGDITRHWKLNVWCTWIHLHWGPLGLHSAVPHKPKSILTHWWLLLPSPSLCLLICLWIYAARKASDCQILAVPLKTSKLVWIALQGGPCTLLICRR